MFVCLFVSGHGFFAWQSSVVECVHVNDLLRLDHDGRLGLVFEATLALEGHPQFVHHGTAEGALWGQTRAIRGTLSSLKTSPTSMLPLFI